MRCKFWRLVFVAKLQQDNNATIRPRERDKGIELSLEVYIESSKYRWLFAK